MKRINAFLQRLPIRWKLTTWSGLMIALLFLCFTFIQYVVINHWLQQSERQSVDSTMEDVLAYFHAGADPVLDQAKSKSFVETATEMHEMIRVLDPSGKPLIVSSHHIPEDWIAPQPVAERQFDIKGREDERLLIERAPLLLPAFSGTVEVIRNPEEMDHLANLILIVLVSGAAGAVLLSVFGGLFLSRQLLEPVRLLTDTMKKIRGEGLTERVPTKGNGDEFSDLSSIFNEMMDRLEVSFHQQKQFIEDASHELRTPLAILEGHVSMLNRWGKHDPEILDESLGAITQETARLRKLVQELLEMTRAESFQVDLPSETDVHSVLKHVVQNLEVLYPEFDFVLDRSGQERLLLAVRPEHLEQVMFILLDNAIKYSHAKKRIEISAGRTGQRAWVEVRDFGEGIPAGDLPHVFDRFYRVDKARSRQVGGNGLGLSIAQRLVAAYKGTIRVDSEEGAGTKVRLEF